MMNFKQILVGAIALFGIGGVSYGWISMSHTNHALQTQLKQSTARADQQERVQSHNHGQVQNKLQETALSNSDPNISSVANQNHRIREAGPAVNKFFETYYSFDSSSDYDARSNKLLKQGVITNQLAHDPQLFQNDKMASGTNYVDTMELNSFFDNSYVFAPKIDTHEHTVELLAQVSYDSGYDNQSSATNDMIYRVSYDYDDHKITNVQSESSLYHNSDTLYDLHTNGLFNEY